MDFTLHIWRQKNTESPGKLVTYPVSGVEDHMAFFEMLDMLNEQLVEKGADPVAYIADCLEGICGACSLMINGVAHGPLGGTTTCQLHMRSFQDGDHITIEPFRARAFPVLQDLIVDRSSFGRIFQSGGYVSANTGSAPDANAYPISKEVADKAMDAAQCIGCGACVASCKNASAMLFVGAKVGHLRQLPQGKLEQFTRVQRMIAKMDEEGFGCCTNQYECEAVCPKEISVQFISEMNRDYIKALLSGK